MEYLLHNVDKLPFLDTILMRQPGGYIIIDWYQKPTSSNRILNQELGVKTSNSKKNMVQIAN